MIEFDILSQSILNHLIFVLAGFFGIIVGNEVLLSNQDLNYGYSSC